MKTEKLASKNISLLFNDFTIGNDGEVKAWFFCAYESGATEFELDRTELETAIDYIDEHDGCPDVLETLEVGLEVVKKASGEKEILNPEISYLLGLKPPSS